MFQRTNKQTSATAYLSCRKAKHFSSDLRDFTMSPNAQESCNNILQHIRSSNVNFVIQETPYSLFLTIRKSFQKKTFYNFPKPEHHSADNVEDLRTVELEATLEYLQAENKDLKLKNEHLARANDVLNNCYNEEVQASESLRIELDDTKERMNCFKANFDNIQSDFTNHKVNKNKLEEKHSKLVHN